MRLNEISSLVYFGHKLSHQVHIKKVATIRVSELPKMAEAMHNNLANGIVDIRRWILVVDTELHTVEEQTLSEEGSKQSNLWGINPYPREVRHDDFVEFDSIINIRPLQQNMSRGVDDPDIRKQVRTLACSKFVARTCH
jgi:hypothetical protein